MEEAFGVKSAAQSIAHGSEGVLSCQAKVNSSDHVYFITSSSAQLKKNKKEHLYDLPFLQ